LLSSNFVDYSFQIETLIVKSLEKSKTVLAKRLFSNSSKNFILNLKNKCQGIDLDFNITHFNWIKFFFLKIHQCYFDFYKLQFYMV